VSLPANGLAEDREDKEVSASGPVSRLISEVLNLS